MIAWYPAFIRLRRAGLTPANAEALAKAGYDVVGRVEVAS
jgi:hypothetical protein